MAYFLLSDTESLMLSPANLIILLTFFVHYCCA